MDTTPHLARLARQIAKSLNEFAAALEDEVDEQAFEQVAEVAEPARDHNLGTRQRQIVELPGLATEDGMKTASIATSIDYEVPNTYSTLQALARAGIVEQVPDKEPQHWRLARRYRSNAPAFMRIAAHVRRGEWTTYGDISIAVMGSPKGARGVGRAAATVPDFPNPHRVLMEGGTVNPNWRSDDGGGPEECERRLREEGVRLDEEGRADRAQRVAWEELMRRDAVASIDEDPAA
jgi:alkylated DNA nucleotide flippase Atl1